MATRRCEPDRVVDEIRHEFVQQHLLGHDGDDAVAFERDLDVFRQRQG